MKYFLFVLVLIMASCGSLSLDDLIDNQDDVEDIDAGDIDPQVLSDTCKKACVGFDFLSCLEMMTRDLSVGDYLTDQACEALCKKAASLYGGQGGGRTFKPECLLSGSCSGMVECFSK